MFHAEEQHLVVGWLSAIRSGDLVTATKRPHRHTFEGASGVPDGASGEGVPVAGANVVVVDDDILVQEANVVRDAEVFGKNRVEASVHPVAVAPVGLPPHPLATKARPLGVPLRSLVEAVDLELQPVIAEVADQVSLQRAGRLVGDALPAEVRVDGEPLEPRDPRPMVGHLEAHHARAGPVDVDHEASVARWIGYRTLELVRQGGAVARRPAAEKRLDVLVVHEVDEEVEIVLPRAADRDHEVSPSGARRDSRMAPVPSATPARISARPARAETVTG